MAFEKKHSTPELTLPVKVVMDGDKQVVEFLRTVEQAARGNDFLKYWGKQEEMIDKVAKAANNYKDALERKLPSDNYAKELINTTNALKATTDDLPSLFKDFSSINELIGKAAKEVGQVIGELSPSNFRVAFQLFSRAKAEYIEVAEAFNSNSRVL